MRSARLLTVHQERTVEDMVPKYNSLTPTGEPGFGNDQRHGGSQRRTEDSFAYLLNPRTSHIISGLHSRLVPFIGTPLYALSGGTYKAVIHA
jgi:hypothetical protein